MLPSAWHMGCPAGKNKSRDARPFGPTHLPPIKAGGGFQRTVAERRDKLLQHADTGEQVALHDWGSWYGENADKVCKQLIEASAGGSLAKTTRRLYEGQFAQWERFRAANGMSAYLEVGSEFLEKGEESVLSYLALSVGPLGKDISTVTGHLNAVGYSHRVRVGENPILEMPMVMLMVRGLRRAKCHTRRKRPITLEDLKVLKGMLDLKNSDQLTIWAAALLGWFFMLRMSEFTDNRGPLPPEGRHPILISDIDPLCKGELAKWGDRVDEITIHISGSKNDWLNQGCVRSHAKVSGDSPNSEIFAARALIELRKCYPAKFNNRDAVLATWRNGGNINQPHITALLRAAVSKNGSDPAKYSLHSLRAGGATALYRATQDIHLVARFGRWKSSSISAYLRESRQMMSGLIDCMVKGGGHVLHTAKRGETTTDESKPNGDERGHTLNQITKGKRDKCMIGKTTRKGVGSNDM